MLNLEPNYRSKEDKVMESAVRTDPVPKWKLWAGRVISAIAILFLLFDSVAKLMKIAPVKWHVKNLDIQRA